MQCGAITGSIERPVAPRPTGGGVITPVHDLNVPYEGPIEEYETPTAEMLFPPTPMQTPMQTPLPGTAQTPLPGTAQTPLPGMVQTPGDQGMYNIPTGPSDYAPVNDIRNGVDFRSGRPSPYMQPPSPWMNQRPLGVDVNVAYVENHDDVDRGVPHQPMTQDFFMMSSGKRKRDDYASQLASGSYIPQQDGSGDLTIEFLLPEVNKNSNSSSRCNRGSDTDTTVITKGASSNPVLPQQDGVHDEYDAMFHFQGVATEDYNINTPGNHVDLRVGTPAVGTPAVGTPIVGTPKPAKSEAVEDEEPPLNEDDDDDDDLDDLEQGEEEPNTQHLVLAQFDKVTRTKSRWKCTLKDGIMHINNRDILFNKANGEFEF